MDTLRTIVTGIDFSECSADALHQAARIAAWSGAHVTPLHVVEPVIYDVGQPMLSIGIPTPMDLSAEAQEQWTAFAPDVPGRPGLKLELAVGHRYSVIIDAVRSRKADLLVIGAHGSWDSHRPIGSLAGSLVRGSPCKTLVVRPGHRGAFRSVLACVDFSPASRVAVDQAIRVAAQDGAELRLLHVYADPLSTMRSSGRERVLMNMPDFDVRYRKAVIERVGEFCNESAHEFSALKARIDAMANRNHGRGICDYVLAHGCDLVVIGTRGRASVRELFLGSTAERVVNESRSSILAVHPNV